LENFFLIKAHGELLAKWLRRKKLPKSLERKKAAPRKSAVSFFKNTTSQVVVFFNLDF